MDGLTLARAIRDLAPRKPIILASGGDIEEDVDLPPDLIIVQKPLILQAFKQALQQAMNRKIP